MKKKREFKPYTLFTSYNLHGYTHKAFTGIYITMKSLSVRIHVITKSKSRQRIIVLSMNLNIYYMAVCFRATL